MASSSRKKCNSRVLATQGDPRFTNLHRDPPTTVRRSLSCEGSKSSSGNPLLSPDPSRPQVGGTVRASPLATRAGEQPHDPSPAETYEQDYKQRERSTLGFRDLTTEQMSAEHGTSVRGWATAAEGAVRGRMQGARERAVDGCGDEAEADTQRSLASGRGGGVWRCDWSGAFVSELGVGAAGGRGDE
jgi:hypothetical protein